jgi:Fe-S-cluster containining protein
MTDEDATADPLPAGDFSSWLIKTQAIIQGEGEADVPCAGCTACCRSSQFIHIDPDETETLARIPSELLSPAPRSSAGQVVLGYDEHGCCPMLVDNRCSIYEHRPRTCRAYDCRIFAATGVEVDDDKVLVARRVRRWQFAFSTEEDQTRRRAVRTAAAFLDRHPDLLPGSGVAVRATQVAATAIAIHDAFVRPGADAPQTPTSVEPDPEQIRQELAPGKTDSDRQHTKPNATGYPS